MTRLRAFTACLPTRPAAGALYYAYRINPAGAG
jgi:hypothetical protein